jgi:hypothetical protein
LLCADPNVSVHFASFAPIEKAVSTTSAYATRVSPSAQPIKFHEIQATDYLTAILRPEHRMRRHFWFPPGILFTPWVLWTLVRVAQPWTGPEFVTIYKETCRIIDEVDPHVIAVDPILSPAITACRHLGLHFVILAPNTIKDFAVAAQPRGEIWWKYPM